MLQNRKVQPKRLSRANLQKLLPEDSFFIKEVPEMGLAVFTKTFIPKGQYCLEYKGELIRGSIAIENRKEHLNQTTDKSFLYELKYNDKKFAIDATYSSVGTYGRLINHSKSKSNVKPKLVVDDVKNPWPRLIFYAKADIQPGKQLFYDYGDNDAQTTREHPWLLT